MTFLWLWTEKLIDNGVADDVDTCFLGYDKLVKATLGFHIITVMT